jgi:hypothetical protein
MGLLDVSAPIWLPIDPITGARETIDIAHAKIHEAKSFTNTYAQALSVGSAINVTITAPASAVGFIHFTAVVEAVNLGTFTFSESPGASAGSDLTAITYNCLRSSAVGSPASVAGTIIYESSGTILETHYTTTTKSSIVIGGGVTPRFEYILKPSTSYLLRWLNTGAVTANTVIQSVFYY